MSPQAVDPPKLPTAETNQAVLAAGADASKYRPNAPLASQIIGDKFRLTILTDGLIRFEWSEDGLFEDRASTFAVNRELPTPKFELIESEERVEIVTDRFHLEYDRAKPSPSGLTCLCEKTAYGEARYFSKMWRYGQKIHSLGGTSRTLDFTHHDAKDNFNQDTPHWDGVISFDGFAVIDDSKTMLFTPDNWVAVREPNRMDFYLFAYGVDYRAAIKALHDVSGHCPILPRWVLGNWWSRYYPYTQDEYIALMDRFKEEKIPLSVAVIDMDWHVVDVDPKHGAGWTGWTWNDKLFPNHVKFLEQLHERGLKTTLNTHPADGVRSFEKIYGKMCEFLGRDASTGHPITFDISDRKFTDAYFNILHRSLEDEGVDFWWPDWQQGDKTKTEGIDPLWMLNHFHFLDSGINNKRPIGFSRYAGPGGHRYPVGFSGDTNITWDSLQFQPQFTATASNIGFGWWSHDIGGHHRGYKDDELQARWVQVGLWSPMLRLHCTSGQFYTREPWRYNDESREVCNRALRFRHRLVPYLYTMAVRNSLDGRSLVEPIYYDHPNEPLAYKYRNTFGYGSQLIACPVTTPRNKSTTFSETPAWIPEGRYVDIFTGTVYDGGRTITFHRPLDKVPVLAREGAIVPLDAEKELENGCPLPKKIEVLLVVGADGSFELTEDDGNGATTESIQFSRTPITYSQQDGRLTIGPNDNPLLESREWSVRLLAYTPTDKINATVNGKIVPITQDKAWSPSDPNGILVHLGNISTNQQIVLDLGESQPQLDKNDVPAECHVVMDAAQISNEAKDDLWAVLKEVGKVPLHVLLSRLEAVECPEGLKEASPLEIVKKALLERLLADSRAT